jgi:chemotaxis protein methyltransferase CheR
MSDGTADVSAAALLSASDFRKISELAHRKFGLSLKSGKEGLVAARLGKTIRQGGFGSFADYHRHILADGTGQALIELIDSLTTNHTCFLREPTHFDFLSQVASAEFQNFPSLRIWSAACSSGEEPYSLGMCLTDVGHKGNCRWVSNFRIVATDISTRVLARAERGMYDSERFAGIPEHWWRKYLLRGRGGCEGWYKVKPEIRRLVEFERLNLIEPLPRRLSCHLLSQRDDVF